MKVVLMVAEKPLLAQSLAKILSHGQMHSRRGSNNACHVHEYRGQFLGYEANFKFTSVCGHVNSLDFSGKYNNWDQVDPAELFTAPTISKEANPKLQMVRFLSQEARAVDYLVLWLDCDKEGENICFEVIDAVADSMKRARTNEQTIFRAKFSAITERDIFQALNHLGRPNENESLSVDARQELDLRIGCAFTRFQTRYFHGKYGDLDSSLISYGPCQTPTLGFCVERHDRIQSFQPEPYWTIAVTISKGSNDTTMTQDASLSWSRGRIFDREVAQMFSGMIRSAGSVTVAQIQRQQKTKSRPTALNTVEMLRVASSGLGMSPHDAMHIAEKLYTQGFISYPRTETTSYPENFDLRHYLKQQRSNASWGDYVGRLLDGEMTRPKKGADAGDHPPITPMRSADHNTFGGDSAMWRLYEYIASHFIATISPDCKYEVVTVHFSCESEKLTCASRTVLNAGFTEVMSWKAVDGGGDPDFDASLPSASLGSWSEGQTYPVSSVRLEEHQTTAPGYLTESDLISLMEKHGIGTDASIPVHINNICERNYVQVVMPGRRLRPTPLGIVLVHGYQKIDAELVLPTMRSAVEEQLNLIARGKARHQDVLQHTLRIFRLKFQHFVLSLNPMDELFEVTFSKLSETGKPLSRCGKCRRFMKLIVARPQRLHCAHCDETYSLPQGGSIRTFREMKCPLDGFEVLFYAHANSRAFPLCPYCYNNPPFDIWNVGGPSAAAGFHSGFD